MSKTQLDATNSQASAKQTEEVERGIRWSYSDVLLGKSSIILLISSFILLVATIALLIITYGDDTPARSIVISMIKEAVTIKPEKLAQSLTEFLVFFTPLLMLMWPIMSLILTLIYNIRDRNTPRTKFNLYEHEIETSYAWTWVWSIFVGIIDFTGLFFIIACGIDLIKPYILEDLCTLLTAAATVCCLVFAERRITYISRLMASLSAGNYLMVDGILDGEFNEQLPEDKRDDANRVKVAMLVRLGIFRSPHVSALIVAGIDLRTKVKLFSGFLNSAIHGFLSGISFGIAATVANNLGTVAGVFAEGKGNEFMAEMKQRENEEGKKPVVIIEIALFLICVLWVVLQIVNYLSTL